MPAVLNLLFIMWPRWPEYPKVIGYS